MKKEFIGTCDVDLWQGLSPAERSALIIQASIDPVFFWNSPMLGNFPPWPMQAKILKDFYKKDKEERRIFSDMMFIAGRRSGKTTLTGLVAGYEVFRLHLFKSPQQHYGLGANQEIQIINVAPKYEQAKDTIFAKFKEIMRNSPWMMSQRHEYVNESIEFKQHNIKVQPFGSNSTTGVGRTAKAFLTDEVSYFTDVEGGRSAKEVYMELSKSTATFLPWNEGVNIAISSVRFDGDFLTSRYYQAQESPKGWEDTMMIWKPTWELNPNLTMDVLQKEKDKDPEEFARQYGAEPGMAVRTFFEEKLMDRIINNNKDNVNWFGEEGSIPNLEKIKRAPDALYYIIGTDPSAKNDSFGVSIGYVTRDLRIIIQGTTSFKAKKGELIDTDIIKRALRPFLERLPVRYYIFDIYFHTDLVKMVEEYGIESFQHILKRADWMKLKEDLMDDDPKTSIPNFPQLTEELSQLIDIKDTKIDHPMKGSKDAADSACQITSFIRRNQEKMETDPRRRKGMGVSLLYSKGF